MRMPSIWSIYLRRFLRLAPIPTIIFAVILYPLGVSAQPCDEIDKLITSTPAPPHYPGGWSAYIALGWNISTFEPAVIGEPDRAGVRGGRPPIPYL